MRIILTVEAQTVWKCPKGHVNTARSTERVLDFLASGIEAYLVDGTNWEEIKFCERCRIEGHDTELYHKDIEVITVEIDKRLRRKLGSNLSTLISKIKIVDTEKEKKRLEKILDNLESS